MTQNRVWHDIPADEYNKKGDLTTSDASGNPALLSVGSNGESLFPRSSADNGLVWAHIQTYYGVVQTYEGVIQFKEEG